MNFSSDPSCETHFFINIAEISNTRAHACVWMYLLKNWTRFQHAAWAALQTSSQPVPPEIDVSNSLRGAFDTREPDGSWYAHIPGLLNFNTSAVLEVAYSQTRESLYADAQSWLNRGAKCVITIKLSRLFRDRRVPKPTQEGYVPGSIAKFTPRFLMTARVWLPSDLPPNAPPPEIHFGNVETAQAPLLGPNERFLEIPIEVFFAKSYPAQAQQYALQLSPTGTWSIDLYDLQQEILKNAQHDGHLVRGRRHDMPYYW